MTMKPRKTGTGAKKVASKAGVKKKVVRKPGATQSAADEDAHESVKQPASLPSVGSIGETITARTTRGLKFPDKRSGAIVDEVPGAVDTRNAACSGVVRKRLVGGQQDTRIVHAETEAMICLEAFLPVVPVQFVVGELILNRVRSAKSRAPST